jgi:hypothetical protein
MKKRYLFLGAVVVIVCLFFVSINLAPEVNNDNSLQSAYPRIGQKLWSYNMNKHQWRAYKNGDDEKSKEEIILRVNGFEGNEGYTSYNLLTGNEQVPKEDLWIGEASQEFLNGKILYSFFPRTFEYYEIVFNGVKFIPRKLAIDEVSDLFKGYNIIKVSDLKKGTYKTDFSKKSNKFLVLNDTNEDFYKYYIVPNDSKKLEIGEFSNQFSVNDEVEIQIQRLEGCSKSYPCYKIQIGGGK